MVVNSIIRRSMGTFKTKGGGGGGVMASIYVYGMWVKFYFL